MPNWIWFSQENIISSVIFKMLTYWYYVFLNYTSLYELLFIPIHLKLSLSTPQTHSCCCGELIFCSQVTYHTLCNIYMNHSSSHIANLIHQLNCFRTINELSLHLHMHMHTDTEKFYENLKQRGLKNNFELN